MLFIDSNSAIVVDLSDQKHAECLRTNFWQLKKATACCRSPFQIFWLLLEAAYLVPLECLQQNLFSILERV